MADFYPLCENIFLISIPLYCGLAINHGVDINTNSAGINPYCLNVSPVVVISKQAVDKFPFTKASVEP